MSCCTFLIASGSTVGFPVPQMQEGVDEREALDCFVMYYLDYCAVMGWFQRKTGCAYDDNTEDGRAQRMVGHSGRIRICVCLHCAPPSL